MDKALDYIKNADKTDEKEFNIVIECIDSDAFNIMQSTKEKYNKTDGVLGYHLIQSFKPGEVDYNTHTQYWC